MAADLYRTAGLRAFYRGYLASLLTHAPAAALFWSIYYPTKARLRHIVGIGAHQSHTSRY